MSPPLTEQTMRRAISPAIWTAATSTPWGVRNHTALHSLTSLALSLSADKQDASFENERNSMWLRTPEGVDVAVVQIAGVLARRIVCDSAAGDKLALGETYGLIRFGSRLDTYFPEGSRVLVETDQRAIGGETILAELS